MRQSNEKIKGQVIRRTSRKEPNSTMDTVTQVFFIVAPGTWGISPLSMHARHPATSG